MRNTCIGLEGRNHAADAGGGQPSIVARVVAADPSVQDVDNLFVVVRCCRGHALREVLRALASKDGKAKMAGLVALNDEILEEQLDGCIIRVSHDGIPFAAFQYIRAFLVVLCLDGRVLAASHGLLRDVSKRAGCPLGDLADEIL